MAAFFVGIFPVQLISDLFSLGGQLRTLRDETTSSISRIDGELKSIRAIANNVKESATAPSEQLAVLERGLRYVDSTAQETMRGISDLLAKMQRDMDSMQAAVDACGRQLSDLDRQTRDGQAILAEKLDLSSFLLIEKRVQALEDLLYARGAIAPPAVELSPQNVIERPAESANCLRLSVTEVVQVLRPLYRSLGMSDVIAEALANEVCLTLSFDQPVFVCGSEAKEFVEATASCLVGDTATLIASLEDLQQARDKVFPVPPVVADMTGACWELLSNTLPNVRAPKLIVIDNLSDRQLREVTRQGLLVMTRSLGALDFSMPAQSGKNPLRIGRIIPPQFDGGTNPSGLDDLMNLLRQEVDARSVERLIGIHSALKAVQEQGQGDWSVTESWSTGWLLPFARAWGISLIPHAHLFVDAFPRGLKGDPRLLWMILNFMAEQPVVTE